MKIQVITNEWIDMIELFPNQTCHRVQMEEERGTYEISESALILYWNYWGQESFDKIDEYTYIHLNPERVFERTIVFPQNTEPCIFHYLTKKVYTKSNSRCMGTFSIFNNYLYIRPEGGDALDIYTVCENGKQFMYHEVGTQENEDKTKMIAIVFPQFHEIPENNLFWGKGFTEWTLLKPMKEVIHGEPIKKPHADIGYYNLNEYEHRKYMRIMAERHHIYGFCYYHYWFKNKKVMYEPLEKMLEDNEPNMPFLFCWANEQWTRRWDGGNNEVLLSHDYSSHEENVNHFYYLLPFFKHKNYIKQENKPIFIFYRIEEKDVQAIENIIDLWNELARQEGFHGIHVCRFLGPFDNRNHTNKINGYIEFQPGYTTQMYYKEIQKEGKESIFENYGGHYDEETYLRKNEDVRAMVENGTLSSGFEHYRGLNEKEKKVRSSSFFMYDGNVLNQKIVETPKTYEEEHLGICVQWNNTPRRNYTNKEYHKYPHVYQNMNPVLFGDTIRKLLHKSHLQRNPHFNFIFISAWNEWNEQAMLEPNHIDGYEYLKELKKSYLEYYPSPQKKIIHFTHYGGGTEKYVLDIQSLFSEYEHIIVHTQKEFEKYKFMENVHGVHVHSFYMSDISPREIFENHFFTVPIYITVHDLQWLYPSRPNISMDDVKTTVPEQKDIDNFKYLCSRCSTLIFPCTSTLSAYCKYVPMQEYHNKIHVVPHMDKRIHHSFLVIPKVKDTLRIAFIGHFTEYKGCKIFMDLSKYITNYTYRLHKETSSYSIEYHVYGNVDEKIDVQGYEHIHFHGEYSSSTIIPQLHQDEIHGIFHLSIFEESYCYALTESINSGIPIIHNERGSFYFRLKENKKYHKYHTIEDYYTFLIYILRNQGVYLYEEISPAIQPNKWYLTNYMNK